MNSMLRSADRSLPSRGSSPEMARAARQRPRARHRRSTSMPRKSLNPRRVRVAEGVYREGGNLVAGFRCPISGKWTTRVLEGVSTTAQAKRARTDLISDLRNKRDVPANRVTISELASEWLGGPPRPRRGVDDRVRHALRPLHPQALRQEARPRRRAQARRAVPRCSPQRQADRERQAWLREPVPQRALDTETDPRGGGAERDRRRQCRDQAAAACSAEAGEDAPQAEGADRRADR